MPRRLNARIILVVSCILLVTGAVSGWMTAQDQAENLLTAMRQTSSVLVRNLAESCARFLLVEDYADLETFLVNSAELLDIRRLQLCEPDGKLIWDVEHALQRDYRSSIALPLRDENANTFGALSIYSRESNAFKPDEMHLLEGLASDLAFGIVTLRTRAERKRAEAEIRQLNADLERRVAERTAQLEAANKELEAFVYSVSHDLRAPLRHIDGFIHILKEDIDATLAEDHRHYMDTISKAARRMEVLIDDLLSFSRMGRNEMMKPPVALDALVRDVMRELDAQEPGRAVDWRVAELPVVHGDRAMLRLVLVNLISNALKFTRRCAQAEIEIGCMPGDVAETVVFVRDNGAGFDMKYVDKLFGVFQRLHGADEFEGTGIGLANVRRVVSRHGGRTWAEGKVDGGATFYFSLPRVPDESV